MAAATPPREPTWKEKTMTELRDFRLFMWNGRTKEFMGRTGKSWIAVLVFYTIFYTLLATWWGCLLYTRVYFLPDVSEGPYRTDYLTFRGPGISVYPTQGKSKDIRYSVESENSYSALDEAAKAFLQKYQEIDGEVNGTFTAAAAEGGAEGAYIPALELGDDNSTTLAYNLRNLGPCLEDTGFAAGEPCFYLQMNKLWGFKPASLSEDSNKDSGPIKTLTEAGYELSDNFNPLFCHGIKGSDKYFEAIEVYPSEGFDRRFFPWEGQQNWRSPVVAVKFRLNTEGFNRRLRVECSVLSDNIFKQSKLANIGRVEIDLNIRKEVDASEEDATTAAAAVSGIELNAE